MSATSGVSGILAAIQINGATLAEVKVSNFRGGQGTIDMTNRDSARWRQIIVQTREWEITGTFNYISSDVAKKVLMNHWASGSPASLSVVMTFADGTITATGTCLLTDISFANPHDGSAEGSCTLAGHDALALSSS